MKDSDKKQIISMWEAGCKIHEIVRTLPYKERICRLMIKELKDSGDLNGNRPTANEIILSLYNEGHKNPYEIADISGYSIHTVNVTLNKAKLNRTRPSKNYKKRKKVEINTLCEKTQNILEALNDKISPRKIAIMYEVSVQHVYSLKNKYLDN
jgi:DNA invertase Pin-like site-specific DNA recombinase